MIDITSMSYFLVDLDQTSNQPTNLYTGEYGEVSEFIDGIDSLDFCQVGFYSVCT